VPHSPQWLRIGRNPPGHHPAGDSGHDPGGGLRLTVRALTPFVSRANHVLTPYAAGNEVPSPSNPRRSGLALPRLAITWVRGWTKHRLSFLVMVARLPEVKKPDESDRQTAAPPGRRAGSTRSGPRHRRGDPRDEAASLGPRLRTPGARQCSHTNHPAGGGDWMRWLGEALRCRHEADGCDYPFQLLALPDNIPFRIPLKARAQVQDVRREPCRKGFSRQVW
jgi:hypothetical protein